MGKNQGENSESDQGGIQEEEEEKESGRESVGGGGGVDQEGDGDVDQEGGGGVDQEGGGGVDQEGGGGVDQKGDGDGDVEVVEIGGAQRHRIGDHEEDNRKKFTCKPSNSKDNEFVQRNLKHLQEKCKQFSECTNELYSASNYHLILAGEDARLTNICGLMNANGGGLHTTLEKQCSPVERKAIRVSIERQLKDKLASGKLDPTWKKLKTCTEKWRNESALDTVCRLKDQAGEGKHLCGDPDVNAQSRIFFNHELETLHCNCVAINSAGKDNRSQTRWIGITIAGSVICLLFVLTIAVIVLCLRHRKMARKLERHKVRYDTSASRDREDSSATIYQEIHDIARAPKPPSRPQLTDRKLLPQGYQLDAAPPGPERYVRGLNLPRGPYRTSPDDRDDRPHSYLEPLPDPVPGTEGQGRARLGVRTPDAAGMNRGSPYSLARNVAELQPSSPYSLAKPTDEPIHHNDSTARRADDSPYSVGKGYEPDTTTGTYFDSIKVARSRAEDEFGYSKLRVPPGCDAAATTTITPLSADRESLAAGDPQYFELEAEPEEDRAGDVVLVTSTRL